HGGNCRNLSPRAIRPATARGAAYRTGVRRLPMAILVAALRPISRLSLGSALPGLTAAGLIALTAVAYARFLGTGFGATDSLPLIDTSRLGSLSDIYGLFTRPVMAGTRFAQAEVVYRPFASLTFGLDYVIWGLNALGYHLTNLALHLAAVLTVWSLFRLLGLRWWSSLAGASVFAFHPLV